MKLIITFVLAIGLVSLGYAQEAPTQESHQFLISATAAQAVVGEQNATYNGIHRLQLTYQRQVTQPWALTSSIAYLLAPYNRNFKLGGLQGMLGVKHRFTQGSSPYTALLSLGGEYAWENYAFQFNENKVVGEINNLDVLIALEAARSFSKNVSAGLYLEVIPEKRTSLGFLVAYSFFKR
ncbi:hypothetical protein [Tunicatimonas pelagia]|uniref:hypothetical protein n=1 Tax=Tunicatimonas pelagia TaxID=931531 RepID=UPI002665FCBB|nr:hypothetical protein [Tunicatimonas pelagia]WKN43474.1 hypothetical protein P0M28_00635 [Tunicatimonas pelagia]